MKKKKTVKRRPIYPNDRKGSVGIGNYEQNNRSNGTAQPSSRVGQSAQRGAPAPQRNTGRPTVGKAIKKRPVGSRRGNYPKRGGRRGGFIISDVIPFVILALSLLTETCLILNEQSGAVGKVVRELFFGLFGPISYIVPICALFVAFYFKELAARGTLRFKTVALCVLVLVSCCAYSLIAQDGFKDAAFSFVQFWNSGIYGESGGVFGGVLGFLFGKLFGATFASVLFVLAAVLLLTFCLGFTRIGVWKAFFRYESAPSENKTVGKGTHKANESEARNAQTEIEDIPVPEVSATSRRIDTTIIGEQMLPEAKQELSQSATHSSDFVYGFPTDGSDDSRPSSSGFDVLNFNISDGSHTVETVDFTENKNLREKYKPADLMEDFGFNSNEGHAAKCDVYEEAPSQKSPYRKSYAKKEENNKGYSPFANPLISYEEFKKENEGLSGRSDSNGGRKNDQPMSYSPFSDPLTSMNAPVRSSDGIAPQLYIANDATDRWEALNKGSEAEEPREDAIPDITIPAPDEVIEQKIEETGLQTGEPSEAEAEEEPEFAPLSRAYGEGIASNGAFEEEDEGRFEAAVEFEQAPESAAAPKEKLARTPAFASPIAATTQEIKSVDELGIGQRTEL